MTLPKDRAARSQTSRSKIQHESPRQARDHRQLLQDFQSSDDRLDLVRTWAIRHFLFGAVLEDDFQPDAGYATTVALTPAGADWGSWLHERYPDSSDADRMFVILCVFGLEEALVDHQKTDTEGLRLAFERDFLAGKVLIPWRFGRELHDLYASMSKGRRIELDLEQSIELIRGLPIGVSQFGDVLLGPLGVIQSLETRVVLAHRHLPMWHCADLGCAITHHEDLATGQPAVSRMYGALRREASAHVRAMSDWEGLATYLAEGLGDFEDAPPVRLPYLLVNGFTSVERSHLLGESLNSSLIDSIVWPQRLRGPRKGGAPTLVPALTESEVFQGLLAADNRWLVGQLDRCILDGHISIGETEIRGSVSSPRRGNYKDSVAEASRLGVRFRNSASPLLRLRALVKAVTDESDEGSLGWSLRRLGLAGQDTQASLDRCIETEPPNKVIDQLVLHNAKAAARAIDFFKFAGLEVPTTRAADDAFVDTIIWKLGFDAPAYPSAVPLLVRRLLDLRNVSQVVRGRSDADIEALRSAGMSAAVALEGFLADSLYFVTWAMWSDHVSDSKFIYRASNARAFAQAFLNGHLSIATDSGGIVSFDETTTMRPLLAGFRELALLLPRFLDEEARYLRPDSDVPAYVKLRLTTFPFRHVHPVLDLAPEAVSLIASTLAQTASSLDAVPGIRNALGHPRDGFPESSALGDAAENALSAVASLLDRGLAVNVRNRVGRQTDEFGRILVTMRDHADKDIEIEPSDPHRSVPVARPFKADLGRERGTHLRQHANAAVRVRGRVPSCCAMGRSPGATCDESASRARIRGADVGTIVESGGLGTVRARYRRRLTRPNGHPSLSRELRLQIISNTSRFGVSR